MTLNRVRTYLMNEMTACSASLSLSVGKGCGLTKHGQICLFRVQFSLCWWWRFRHHCQGYGRVTDKAHGWIMGNSWEVVATSQRRLWEATLNEGATEKRSNPVKQRHDIIWPPKVMHLLLIAQFDNLHVLPWRDWALPYLDTSWRHTCVKTEQVVQHTAFITQMT